MAQTVGSHFSIGSNSTPFLSISLFLCLFLSIFLALWVPHTLSVCSLLNWNWFLLNVYYSSFCLFVCPCHACPSWNESIFNVATIKCCTWKSPLHIALFMANWLAANWLREQLAKGNDLFGCWTPAVSVRFFFSSFAPELFNCSTVQRFSLIRGYIIRLSFSQKNNFCAYLLILSLVSIRNQSSQHQKIHTRAHEHQLNRFHTQNHIIFRFNYSIVNLFVAHEPFFFSILLLNPAVACRSQVFCDVLGR